MMSAKIGDWSNAEPADVLPQLMETDHLKWGRIIRYLLKNKNPILRGKAAIALALWHKQTAAPYNKFEYQKQYWSSIRHNLNSRSPEGAIEYYAKKSGLVLALARTRSIKIYLSQILANPGDLDDETLSEAIRLAIIADGYGSLDIVNRFMSSSSVVVKTVCLKAIGQTAIHNDSLRTTCIKLLIDVAVSPGQESDIYDMAVDSLIGISGEDSTIAIQFIKDHGAPDAVLAANDFIQQATESRNPKVVLIVEDSTELAEIVVATLERLGIEAEYETHGVKGLERLRRNQYQYRLLFLDISLPDITGWKILDEYKAWCEVSSLSPMKVVVMTAYGDPANRLVGRLQGVDEYLVKPFTADEVEAVSKRILGIDP